MKNKVLKISFLAIVLVLTLGIVNAVQANSISKIDMDIYIDRNGDANVTETWTCKTNSGTEVYHPYYNLGNSNITNLAVSEGNTKYTTLDSWNTSGNLSSKAYKCGINKIFNGVELCWGISEYSSHVYTVKYNISKFVSELSDSQMIYWTLIPYEFSNSIGKAKIKIHTDFNIPNTIDVWGYGNYGGLAYVSEGSINMESKGRLQTNEYMTILVKFPKETFKCSNKINNSFEYYHNMADKGATKYEKKSNGKSSFSFLSLLTNFISSTYWIFIILIIIKSKKFIKNGKEYGKEKNRLPKVNDYYRDIPFKGDLFRAYFVGYIYGIIKNKTDLLGAVILKWIKEEKAKTKIVDKIGIGKSRESLAIELICSADQIQNEQERKLYEMLYEASEDGVLEKNELKKWCRKRYSRILKWFDDVIRTEKNRMFEEKLLLKTDDKTVLHTMRYKPDYSLTSQACNLAGLKRFLLDYTMIEEKQAVEVAILEEYLIYSQMLGIAKKVAKEFKELYPEQIMETHYTSYDDIIWINYCSSRGIYAANSARSAAENAASNYSSGGGGFSSGGGGGGSFGGGGGRRRFPLD